MEPKMFGYSKYNTPICESNGTLSMIAPNTMYFLFNLSENLHGWYSDSCNNQCLEGKSLRFYGQTP